MLLTRTRVFCPDCGDYHQGEVVERDGAVFGITHCGAVKREHLISSNADLYLKLRRASTVDTAAPAPPRLKYFLNFIPITNACNFKCAVCASHEPGEEGDRFLTTDEVVRRAEVAYRGGARILHLTGGEPTVHPDLLAIVERLAGIGLSVAMVSNGYRLGREPELARSLKQAGLSRVCLQFDSLDEDTLETLHRAHLPEKMAAIRNVLDTGLKLGFNAIITRHNVAELPRLLEHHLQLGHAVKTVMFASAAPIGRFELAPEDSVDREEMVTSLVQAGDRYGFSIDDVLPLPTYHPWGLEAHPDCGVHIVFVRTPEGIRPLNHYLDMWAAYRRLAAVKDAEGFYARKLRPVLCAIMSVRKGRRLEALWLACRLLLKSPKVSMVNVGIADYRAAMFLDEQRLCRCSSLFHTSMGPVRSCFHYFGGPHHPGSRKNEVLRGGC